MMCPFCHSAVEVSVRDFRPFVFHRCSESGLLVGLSNPFFHNRRRGGPFERDSRSKPVLYTYRRNVYDK